MLKPCAERPECKGVTRHGDSVPELTEWAGGLTASASQGYIILLLENSSHALRPEPS